MQLFGYFQFSRQNGNVNKSQKLVKMQRISCFEFSRQNGNVNKTKKSSKYNESAVLNFPVKMEM